MARIRIVCKWPPQQPPDPRGWKLHVFPTWSDVAVYLVDDDGTERELEGVTAIRWEARAGTTVPVAVLEFAGVEVDVEGMLETTICREQEPQEQT